ncbi:MAG: APC family permease [Blastocatellia bacterium]
MEITKQTPSLTRGMGLVQATASNMLMMIGIGPFITIPLILAAMGGPHAMLGWLVGAIIAICDGLVWAELGAAMPGSGGSYHYLLKAYGEHSLGRLMSFLFIWQTVCTAPFSVAGGAVGFANYSKFLWPTMTPTDGKLLAMGVCALVTILLYRDIRSIGKLSVVMWVIVLFTVAWVLVAGIANFKLNNVLDFPENSFSLSTLFFVGLGKATLQAIYDYGGYNNVCFVAGEVKAPERTIPKAVIYSILAVAAIYLTMNVTLISVVPWREAITPGTLANQAIVADFTQRLYGSKAAIVMTVLILFTTFASLFSVMLGYSRVPYAAAVEGRFFKAFARLHPTKNFPNFSLVFIGATAAAACWLSLETLIAALIIIEKIARDIGQAVAVIVIRRHRPEIKLPFKMWLYPLPSLIALIGWFFILQTNNRDIVLWGLALTAFGIVAYLIQAKFKSEWPFNRHESDKPQM